MSKFGGASILGSSKPNMAGTPRAHVTDNAILLSPSPSSRTCLREATLPAERARLRPLPAQSDRSSLWHQRRRHRRRRIPQRRLRHQQCEIRGRTTRRAHRRRHRGLRSFPRNQRTFHARPPPLRRRTRLESVYMHWTTLVARRTTHSTRHIALPRCPVSRTC